MGEPSTWVTDDNVALFTDLYELTMLQAYLEEGLLDPAVFSLFFRKLPSARRYLLACGLDDVLTYLERIRFDEEALAYLQERFSFSQPFLEWLAAFRFTGDVWAMPEGTPVFPQEPLLEVVAPLPEAQLIETFVLNQVHLQTVLASKASRVVEAARGRAVVDFGLRRVHGTDAGLKSARAFHVAGVSATSNVLAGLVYGVDVTGTMAHSYVQAHEDESDSFRAFSELYPRTVLLVDTYDTLEGVRRVIDLAKARGSAFAVRAIRLDSGDLAALSKEARHILDDAGLVDVQIIASGGLDEYKVDELVAAGAPIDAFGVGTSMGVSDDAPSLDMAYKLTEYAGTGRMKTSTAKATLPGRKQVFRIEEEGLASHDVIARADELLAGRPLLVKVMEGGRRLPAGRASLDRSRVLAARERSLLPERLRRLAGDASPYLVEISPRLQEELERVRAHLQGKTSL